MNFPTTEKFGFFTELSPERLAAESTAGVLGKGIPGQTKHAENDFESTLKGTLKSIEKQSQRKASMENESQKEASIQSGDTETGETTEESGKDGNSKIEISGRADPESDSLLVSPGMDKDKIVKSGNREAGAEKLVSSGKGIGAEVREFVAEQLALRSKEAAESVRTAAANAETESDQNPGKGIGPELRQFIHEQIAQMEDNSVTDQSMGTTDADDAIQQQSAETQSETLERAGNGIGADVREFVAGQLAKLTGEADEAVALDPATFEGLENGIDAELREFSAEQIGNRPMVSDEAEQPDDSLELVDGDLETAFIEGHNQEIEAIVTEHAKHAISDRPVQDVNIHQQSPEANRKVVSESAARPNLVVGKELAASKDAAPNRQTRQMEQKEIASEASFRQVRQSARQSGIGTNVREFVTEQKTIGEESRQAGQSREGVSSMDERTLGRKVSDFARNTATSTKESSAEIDPKTGEVVTRRRELPHRGLPYSEDRAQLRQGLVRRESLSHDPVHEAWQQRGYRDSGRRSNAEFAGNGNQGKHEPPVQPQQSQPAQMLSQAKSDLSATAQVTKPMEEESGKRDSKQGKSDFLRPDRVNGSTSSSSLSNSARIQTTTLSAANPSHALDRFLNIVERMSVNGQSSRMQLHVDLENGENMKILLKYAKGLVQTVFVTDSDGLRSAIKDGWEQLQRQLQASNIQASNPGFEGTFNGDGSTRDNQNLWRNFVEEAIPHSGIPGIQSVGHRVGPAISAQSESASKRALDAYA